MHYLQVGDALLDVTLYEGVRLILLQIGDALPDVTFYEGVRLILVQVGVPLSDATLYEGVGLILLQVGDPLPRASNRYVLAVFWYGDFKNVRKYGLLKKIQQQTCQKLWLSKAQSIS